MKDTNNESNTNLISLKTAMGERFGRYAKYIIQERALPDIRDGLKPVQRRILYAMFDLKLLSNTAYKKSARVVGEVIGKYHPHGDTPIYEAMVRLSQDWKMYIPLVDMQGNNGSIDGDPAAAMRYTEARLAKASELLLKDINENVVKFNDNFDNTESEPEVLPSRIPNLLINGSLGIAAGYATNIPSHNFSEVVNALIFRLNNPNCSLKEIMSIIPGPDFATGAKIINKRDIKNIYKTGNGKLVVRGKIIFSKNNSSIIITELPFDVQKQSLIKKINDLAISKKISGIISIADESDKNGISIKIDLEEDSDVKAITAYLYKYTQLQVNYFVNLVAIDNYKPMTLSLLGMIDSYLKYQRKIIYSRSLFRKNKIENRLEIITGLIIAINSLDLIIKIIRQSSNKKDSIINLMRKFSFSEIQATAIVQLQLYRLTSTDISLLKSEQLDLKFKLNALNEILNNEISLKNQLILELHEYKKMFDSKRKTKLINELDSYKESTADLETKLISNYDVYLVGTKSGYIKVMESSFPDMMSKKFQKTLKQDDVPLFMQKLNSKDNILLITSKGNYISLPIHKLEITKPNVAAKHLNAYVTLDPDETIINYFHFSKASVIGNKNLVIVTSDGLIKITELEKFKIFSSTPKKAISIRLNKRADVIMAELFTESKQTEAIVVNNLGYATRFEINSITKTGLNSAGIKAINLGSDQHVIGSSIINENSIIDDILIISSDGYYKRLAIRNIFPASRTSKGKLLYRKYRNNFSPILGINVLRGSSLINFVLDDNTKLIINSVEWTSSGTNTRLTKFSDTNIKKYSVIEVIE